MLHLLCPAENVFNLFSRPELGGMKYMDVRRKIHDSFAVSSGLEKFIFTQAKKNC